MAQLVGSSIFERSPEGPVRQREVERVARVLPHLVSRELRLRYRRTRFGIAWGAMQPLIRFAAMGFIFGSIARLDIDRYFEFLLIGILVWTWWATGVTAATTSIVEQPELVRRPGLPRMVVPLVAIATALIDFLFAVPLLLVVLLVTGGIGWPVLLVPMLLVTEGIWIVGVGLLTCASNVYFRDTKPIVETAMLIGFYVTPVVYTLELAPDWAQAVLAVNPLAEVITSFRVVLLDGRLPGLWNVAWPLITGIPVLVAGIAVFRRSGANFLDEL